MYEGKRSEFEDKKWTTPQISIITRSGHKESVLAVCKTAPGTGAFADHEACIADGKHCDQCSDLMTS